MNGIYERIFANAGLSFCSTLAALNFVGMGEKAIIGAIINAILIAGVAAFKEYQITLDYKKKNPSWITKTACKLLIF